MEELNLLATEKWTFLQSIFKVTHPFFFVNKTTLLNTWILLGILIILALLVNIIMQKQQSLASYAITRSVEALAHLVEQSMGTFSFIHFAFIGSLFVFILFGNALSIIPFLEEPTKDINTTLALGIISFIYVQWYTIKQQGALPYIKSYFSPFFLMFPINVVGKLANIISISFRLFGNIFGGATISSIYMSVVQASIVGEVIGLISGLNLLITIFFSVFEGFLQAFVFSMLTLTYLSIALRKGSIH